MPAQTPWALFFICLSSFLKKEYFFYLLFCSPKVEFRIWNCSRTYKKHTHATSCHTESIEVQTVYSVWHWKISKVFNKVRSLLCGKFYLMEWMTHCISVKHTFLRLRRHKEWYRCSSVSEVSISHCSFSRGYGFSPFIMNNTVLVFLETRQVEPNVTRSLREKLGCWIEHRLMAHPLLGPTERFKLRCLLLSTVNINSCLHFPVHTLIEMWGGGCFCCYLCQRRENTLSD